MCDAHLLFIDYYFMPMYLQTTIYKTRIHQLQYDLII